jgi:hypothetical protein
LSRVRSGIEDRARRSPGEQSAVGVIAIKTQSTRKSMITVYRRDENITGDSENGPWTIDAQSLLSTLLYILCAFLPAICFASMFTIFLHSCTMLGMFIRAATFLWNHLFKLA